MIVLPMVEGYGAYITGVDPAKLLYEASEMIYLKWLMFSSNVSMATRVSVPL